MRQHNIFLGPIEIAGYYTRLSSGLNQLGIKNDFISFTAHPFGYGGSEKKDLLILAIRALELRMQTVSGSIRIKAIKHALLVLKYFNLIRCIFKYDVFIFGFSQSLLPENADLPMLKRLGKQIIFNCSHGSEMRPPYMSGLFLDARGEIYDSLKIKKHTERVIRRIRYIEKFADIMIGAPYSSSPFGKRSMINHFNLGLPIDFDNPELNLDTRALLDKHEDVVIILHAPSRPIVKGSGIIRGCIDKLIRKGYNIKYVEIVGRTNDEVLNELRRCDFVVDQMYSDTPLAGLATEAAFFGKPAVVGGYGLEELRRWVQDDMWPPSMICEPDHIEEAIESLIIDKEARRCLGSRAQDFVRSKWSARVVAKKYLNIIDGDFPSDWLFDPREIVYPWGGGVSKDNINRMVSALVGEYGVDSLMLDHRPDLLLELKVRKLDKKIDT